MELLKLLNSLVPFYGKKKQYISLYTLYRAYWWIFSNFSNYFERNVDL